LCIVAALRLSDSEPVGLSGRITYGVLLVGLLALLVTGAAFVFYDFTFGLIPILLANPPDSVTSTLNWLWAWLWVVIYGLGAPVLPAALILQAFRARATLDGTVLTVRGLLRTRSADLAVAHVRGETTEDVGEKGLATVALIAVAPGSSQEVRLVLGDSGRLLPRPQLAALADAIASGGLEDDQRRVVVERLRLFVRQRFAVPRYIWADPPPLRRG
jgi:hypothetical protein